MLQRTPIELRLGPPGTRHLGSRPFYPFMEVALSREEVVVWNNDLIERSRDALRRSWALLAQPSPDLFLGRRNLIEPPPIQYE
jgi:hypothetical protein